VFLILQLLGLAVLVGQPVILELRQAAMCQFLAQSHLPVVVLVLLDKRSESRVDQVVVVAGRVVVLLRVALVIRLQFLLARVTRAVLVRHQAVTLRVVVAVLALLVS